MQYHVHCHFWINADSPKEAAQKAMTEIIHPTPEWAHIDNSIVFRVDNERYDKPNDDQCYWIESDGSVSKHSTGK